MGSMEQEQPTSTIGLYFTGPFEYKFNFESDKRKYFYEVTDIWSLDSKFLGLEYTILYHTNDIKNNSVIVIYETEDSIIYVNSGAINIRVRVTSSKPETAFKVLQDIKRFVPPTEVKEDGKINIRFWYSGQQGPVSIYRKIEVPFWKDITLNYSNSTRGKLDKLVKNFKPSHGGQVILWHGHPGTGKTYALRALANEWKSWCSSEYILDPEILFGGSPSYLTNLVLSEDDEVWDRTVEDYVRKPDNQWKLLIMEDTGELISEDAKERTGQGLSRLLNLADGIIGQGLKVLILITTNEPLEKLHPAVARPGRCASIIEFKSLTTDEQHEWNRHHNKSVAVSASPKMLAEMYAEVEQFEIKTLNIEEHRPVGFKAPAGLL